MVIRFSLSSVLAIGVTLALFYLMQFLISGGKSALSEEKMGRIVDIVRVKQELEAQTKQRKAKKPPPPDQPPPEVPQVTLNVSIDDAGFTMSNIAGGADIDISGGGFGISDGEYLPIVKVQPRYPQRALSRGQTGWVIVEFTVSAQGTVKDANVVDNCAWTKSKSQGQCIDNPHTVFDKAAMKAALKFKYKPKVIDGEPVETAGVQNKIIFELAEG
ncbi:MAG: energy transducer TonB [Pseudomonadales bacterium]|nr:energy transducer TonB [Pseudomonadales bacterium]